MKSFSILGDYVASDFLSASESSIEAQLSFSSITQMIMDQEDQPDQDELALQALLQPFLAKESDYLIIDLQDSGMLSEPAQVQKDALRLSRARWADVIRLLARELCTVYTPDRIIVNEHFSPTMYLEEKTFKMYGNSARISRYNMLMRFLFTQMEKETQAQHIIPFPSDVFEVSVLYDEEKDYQYHPCYYHYGQQAMDAILGEESRTQAEEENRIAIAFDHCSETMSWMTEDAEGAVQMDLAERRSIRGFRLTGRDSRWLELAWTENIYAPAYLVERYEGGIWEKVDTIGAEQAPSCWVSGLEPDTEYYFRVTVQADEMARRFGQELICRTGQEED